MKNNNPFCLICGAEDFSDLYRGPIRIGRYGQLSNEYHTVFRCNVCKVGILPGMSIDYESGAYRKSVDSSDVFSDYSRIHNKQQLENFKTLCAMLGTEQLTGKVVADIGCGGGSCLDLIKGWANQTIAIEPQVGYHEELQNNNHTVFQYCSDALASYQGQVDLAVSFAVIEHVEDPVTFLTEIRSLVKPGGKVYISTPNRNDWLIDFLPGVYDRFFYRQAHTWYFESESLSYLGNVSGFDSINICYKHRFDISNALQWIRDHKPTGLAKFPLFNELDLAYGQFLERAGKSDYIFAELMV